MMNMVMMMKRQAPRNKHIPHKIGFIRANIIRKMIAGTRSNSIMNLKNPDAITAGNTT
jgi:hypothetical protein